MSDVIRYTPNGEIGTPSRSGPHRPSGGAASTEDVAFTRSITPWDSLPSQVRALDSGRGDLVGELVITHAGHARKVDGVLHQERTAVRAYRQRLVEATLIRRLARRPDGRLAPAGDWIFHEGTAHRPSAASVWQTDPGRAVKPGPPLRSTAAYGRGGGVPRTQATGEDVSLYLPPSIQDRLAREVPEPSLWLGLLTQWPGMGGGACRQEVVVVRMNASRASVVVAERGGSRQGDKDYTAERMAGLPWRVKRVRYELDHARALAGGDGGVQQLNR